MSEIRNYPLTWPDNVSRRAPHHRGKPQFALRSIYEAVQFVKDEITRLNQGNAGHAADDRTIFSCNVRPTLQGTPASNMAEPADTGVAVYFFLKFSRNGKQMERQIVLTCDKWCKVAYNLWAIGKDIEAQRARARWGCTNLEQSFRGYMAIPERCGGSSWWDLLGVLPAADATAIKEAYRVKGMTMHPDKGGSHADWVKIQEAYEQAMAQVKV